MSTEDSRLCKGDLYDVVGFKNNAHGFQFQLNLLTLYAYRAHKMCNNYSYRLATEMKNASKFDEIVIGYKRNNSGNTKKMGNWVWHLIQCKHKENINSDPSSSRKTHDNIFNELFTYWEAFCNIKSNEEFKDADFEVILCTNAKINEDFKPYFEEKTIQESDLLAFSSKQGFDVKKYSLKPKCKSELEQQFELLYKKKGNKILKNRRALINSFLDKFIETFIYLTNYPNKDELQELIKGEIAVKVGFIDSGMLTALFAHDILLWFANKEGDNKAPMLEIEKEKYSFKKFEVYLSQIKMTELSLKFSRDISFPKIEFNIAKKIEVFLESTNCKTSVLYISSENPLLPALQVNQYLRRTSGFNDFKFKDDIIFLPFKQLCYTWMPELLTETFTAPKFQNLLILRDDGQELDSSIIRHIVSQILNIIIKHKTTNKNKDKKFKKVLFITNQKNEELNNILKSQLKFLKIKYETMSADDKDYLDLTEESLEKILQEKVNFQGNPDIRLKQIINREAVVSCLDANVLEQHFIKNTPILIDNSLPNYDRQNYMKRSVRYMGTSEDLNDWKNLDEEFITIDQFFLQQGTFLLTAEVGFGKTEFFSYLHEASKKSNQNRWIVRINLNEHSKHLEQINLKRDDHERAISLLSNMLGHNTFTTKLFHLSLTDAQDKTKKYPKIVVFCDDLDIESPKYDDKALTFLEALSRTNLHQLWVTAFPHEEEFVKQKLGVSAVLHLNKITTSEGLKYVNNLCRNRKQNYEDIDESICSVVGFPALLDSPVNVKVLVEVLCESDGPSIDVLHFSAKFIDEKFERFLKKISFNEVKVIDKLIGIRIKEDLISIHKQVGRNPNISDNPTIMQILTLVGLTKLNGSKIEFIFPGIADILHRDNSH
ncbi:uncharacterized protein [Euwallacea similis]|uniref:uncharacterized protein n=1 Tax=Euwallacea similis TaxID=1736056 RepID=UPI00344C4C7A